MSPIFWNARGILFIGFFQKWDRIIRCVYCRRCVYSRQLIISNEIKKKKCMSHLAKKKRCVQWGSNELRIEYLPWAPYSLYLSLSDYLLFSTMKKWLGGKRVAKSEEVKAAIDACFEELAINTVSKVMHHWEKSANRKPCWDKKNTFPKFAVFL